MHTIVIGRAGNLRNPLIAELTDKGYSLDYLDPVFLSPEEALESQNLELNQFLLGRPLSKGEVGCWLAHNQVKMLLGGNSCHEWHLVLEDDADCRNLPTAEKLSKLLGEKVGQTAPTIVSLYAPGRIVEFSDTKLARVLNPFTGTVAYAGNTAFFNIENHYGVAMTADWPLFSQEAGFRQFRPPIVCEIESQSQIGTGPRGKSVLSFYLSAPMRLTRAVRAGVPVLLATKAILINPFLRDFKGRLSSIKFRRAD
jgi:hypothetical protein